MLLVAAVGFGSHDCIPSCRDRCWCRLCRWDGYYQQAKSHDQPANKTGQHDHRVTRSGRLGAGVRRIDSAEQTAGVCPDAVGPGIH